MDSSGKRSSALGTSKSRSEDPPGQDPLGVCPSRLFPLLSSRRLGGNKWVRILIVNLVSQVGRGLIRLQKEAVDTISF